MRCRTTSLVIPLGADVVVGRAAKVVAPHHISILLWHNVIRFVHVWACGARARSRLNRQPAQRDSKISPFDLGDQSVYFQVVVRPPNQGVDYVCRHQFGAGS